MNEPLALGGAAPNLDLQDADGVQLAVGDVAGGHSLVLYFMRTADCAVCARHVRELVTARAELERRGARVAVVVPDGPAEAGELRERLNVPFPVLSGRSGGAHEAFGLSKAVFGRLQRSGTVLIDAGGVVRHHTSASIPLRAFSERALLRDLDMVAAP